MPVEGLEPTLLLREADFESAASAIPPHRRVWTTTVGGHLERNAPNRCVGGVPRADACKIRTFAEPQVRGPTSLEREAEAEAEAEVEFGAVVHVVPEGELAHDFKGEAAAFVHEARGDA